MKQGNAKNQISRKIIQGNNAIDIQPIDNPKRETQLSMFYEDMRQDYAYAHFSPHQLSEKELSEHRITLLHSQQLSCLPKEHTNHFNRTTISVTQVQFYGLQFTYEIIIGPFKLNILVLNLQRHSDTFCNEMDSEQMKSGVDVRIVKIDGQEQMIKRIYFQDICRQLDHKKEQVKDGEHLQLQTYLQLYSLYKICSLLGIGPRIIKKCYDLICFNNCIQFAMERCVPIDQFCFSAQGISFSQCQHNLYEQLFRLHSLNLIHHIQPSIILYSLEKKRFIFGKFGFATLAEVIENKYGKTIYEAPNGTCNHLKKLQAANVKVVNLNLKDFQNMRYLLQEIMAQTNATYYSENGMKMDEVDSINIPKSETTMTNRHLQSVSKYGSLPTYYQSFTIHYICRSIQKYQEAARQLVINYMIKRLQTHLNSQLAMNIIMQISYLFQSSNQHSTIVNGVRKYHNLLRHYGPNSQNTIECQLELIKATRTKNTPGLKICEQNVWTMSVMKENSCFVYYVWAYISLLRNAFHQQRLPEQDIYIAQQYLFCMKFFLHGSNRAQAVLIAKLITRYFKDEQLIYFDRFQMINKTIVKIANFCFTFLKTKNKVRNIDIVYNLQYYHSDYRDEWTILESKLIQEISQKFLENTQKSSFDDKWNFLNLLVKIGKDFGTLLKQAQILVQRCIQQTSLLTYSILFKYQRASIKAANKDYQQAFYECEEITKSINSGKFGSPSAFEKEKILIKKLMGEIQIKRCNYDSAIICLEQAFKCIQGSMKLTQLSNQIVYEAMYLLIWLYLFIQKFDEGLIRLNEVLAVTDNFKLDQAYKNICFLTIYITLQLRKGLNDESIKLQVKKYVQQIIVLTFQKHKGSQYHQRDTFQKFIIPISESYARQIDKYFILCETISIISKKKGYYGFFNHQASEIIYQLASYYIQQPTKLLYGLSFIENFIKSKLLSNYLDQFEEIDMRIINLYVKYLIKTQSNRKAIHFLNKILPQIPEIFQQAKYKSFKLMYKAQSAVSGKMLPYYQQLVKHGGTAIKNKNFNILFERYGKTMYTRKLLEKWFSRLFFVDFRPPSNCFQDFFDIL